MSTFHFLVDVVQDLHITDLNTVAGAALMAYEIMITLGQEVDHIWRSQWSTVKVLYLIIRYYTMLFLLIDSFVITNAFLSLSFCRYYKDFQIWGNVVVWPLVDCLIVVRIYALYGQSKKMGVALAALWLSETVACFILLGLVWTPFKSIPNPLPGILTGCLINITEHQTYGLTVAFWNVAAAFQVVYVVLTLVKSLHFWREFGFSKSALTPLLTVFFRDGAAYFLVILAAILMNILIERFGSILLSEVGTLWGMVIPSIATCRLVLNIRGANTPSEFLHGPRQELSTTYMESYEMRFYSDIQQESRTASWMHRPPMSPHADGWRPLTEPKPGHMDKIWI